jgi:hypothetical protein
MKDVLKLDIYLGPYPNLNILYRVGVSYQVLLGMTRSEQSGEIKGLWFRFRSRQET